MHSMLTPDEMKKASKMARDEHISFSLAANKVRVQTLEAFYEPSHDSHTL